MPEWWDKWSWFWSLMIVWSGFWLVMGFGNNFATGSQLGMVFFWIQSLATQAQRHYLRGTVDIYKQLDDINRDIQKNQRKHIDVLTERLAQKEKW